jgi:hypothetical protein
VYIVYHSSIFLQSSGEICYNRAVKRLISTLLLAAGIFVFVPFATYAATSQSVCVGLFVGGATDTPVCNTNQSTTTPTTTPATEPVIIPPETGGQLILPNITDVTVAYQGPAVLITWHNPTTVYFAGVRIIRSPYGIPTSPLAGKVVYQGSGTYTRDTGGIPGTLYYYTAFSYDGAGDYSSGTVFAAIWPGVPQQNQTPPGTSPTLVPPPSQFPFIPTPSGVVSSSSPLFPLSPVSSTTTNLLTFKDISFVQDGLFLTPDLTTNTVPVNGSMPLIIAIPDTTLAAKIPDGLLRALITLNILGHQENYLIRENPADSAFETRLDLTDAPQGGYPFIIEFWPNKGEPFAVSGVLAVTQSPAQSGGFFGFNTNWSEWWLILLLFICFCIFIVLIRRSQHQ